MSSGVISDCFLHEDVDVDADTTEMQSSFLQESEEALIGGPFSAADLAANKIKVEKTYVYWIFNIFHMSHHFPIILPIIYIHPVHVLFLSE